MTDHAELRPAETVAETTPTRHEAPPDLLDALLAMNAAVDQFVAARDAIESAARYKLDKSEWAAAKADCCKGLVENLADVEGAITCVRCQKRVRAARNRAES